MAKNRDAQNKLAEAMTKHSSWLHRAATAQVNDSIELINKESLKLSRILADELDSLTATELKLLGQGKYSTKRLKSVKASIDDWSKDFGQKFSQMTLEGFEQLGGYEAEYTRRSLAAATGNKALAAAPSAAATLAAAKARPLMGEMMADLVKGLAEKNKQVVYNTLRQGINQGMTTPEITRAIVGTKALKRKDGTMQQARVAAARIVRTGRNHVSNVAYEETYQALGVKELIWVSTLDGRTSDACANLDGQRFKVGEPHPTPPAHPNCRSALIPALDDEVAGKRPYVADKRSVGEIPKSERSGKIGQVSAKTTYPQWFARQSAEFQREWLGRTRYELYKKGGYTLDKFVDPLGKRLSLDELRLKDAATFKELFD